MTKPELDPEGTPGFEAAYVVLGRIERLEAIIKTCPGCKYFQQYGCHIQTQIDGTGQCNQREERYAD